MQYDENLEWETLLFPTIDKFFPSYQTIFQTVLFLKNFAKNSPKLIACGSMPVFVFD
ncbi:hypothetical protein F542_340 [Bibersteinia trehalosi USDA-ARS-USMARC-188]|uniref:Uncharacterized protein n=3 Tax=Bibersteinia trehalosi TaxID=47735 RepID=W0RAM4_BIBTR|nr:hypothetical protein WQG_22270 [Bibersteinia trehalosi USDA-ARS-USMARC-192]AHG80753.1 hypothetical protein F542_340 [Bibersteinia trehalosi USDA-ARS-USMARC-188]AHG82900.1 hypothetical protein F543_350 [Bibersteinia trehalosi USDA-ARS-USMARC-189]AHG87507.1 hypothetical protein F544_22800 [Bibersteinia trehalosi USDA-ARS-USMARC-190]